MLRMASGTRFIDKGLSLRCSGRVVGVFPSLPDVAHLPRLVLIVALAVILIVAPLLSALAARRAIRANARAKHARYARSMLILWTITALAIYALRLHGQAPADVGLVPPREPIPAYLAALAIVGFLALGRCGRNCARGAVA